MKKNLFMVAAVALMTLVSCSKEDFNNGVQGGASDIVFSAELEQPAGLPAAEPAEIQSKTSLGTAVNGVRPVSWVKDDQIKINGVTFEAASAGSRTNFTPTGSFNTAATYYAVYPATATSKADHTAITIPASQDGSFAKAAISVAKSSTQSLSFKNVASIIKFQVPADCSNITITSTADLAGTFPVTFGSDGLPVVGTVSSASKTITLTGSFKIGTDYYVAVLPGSHKFTVRLDGYLSKASTTAVATSRANIANLKTLPSPEASTWVIVGAYNSWKNDATAKKLYKDISGFVVKNITLNGEFKMVNGTKWLSTMVPSAAQNKWCLLKENMANMTRSSGTYDIWISSDGKEVCVVNSGSSAPQLNDSNRQYYIVLQHNWDWANRRLHAWIDNGSDATNVNLMGAWPGKAANGTFTYDNSGYSYWEIPNSVYGKKLGIIFSNNGGDQTQNKYFTNYRDDKRFWLEWKDPNRIANEF